MPPVAVLSDDLTGALGLAVLIASANLSVRALTGSALHALAANRAADGAVRVINTESRSLTEDGARAVIRDVLGQLPADTVIAKRFDTTLRGHIAAELSVIMEFWPQAAVIVVPSYPASGRLCIGGYQLINGTPLERTEVADDPQWPIRNSFVPDHFAAAGEVRFIPLNELYQGETALTARIRACATAGAVIVLDAAGDADIALIARATVAIGSPTQRTRDQALEQPFAVRYLDLPLHAIRSDRIDSVVGAFLSSTDARNAEVIVVRPEQERAASSLQPRICCGIAVAVEALIERIETEVAGLICSGGETATAVLDRLNASVIRPEVEFGSLVS